AYDFCSVANEPLLGPVGNLGNLQAHPPAAMVREVQIVIPGWMSTVLGTLSLATLISLFTSYSLYRARRVMPDAPNSLVPEEWGNALTGISGHVDKLTSSFERGLRDVATKSSADSEKLTHIAETFVTLRAALDEKDNEIRRFKKGYDAEVFRKFLYRFIRVD